jgi:hypothetical protein
MKRIRLRVIILVGWLLVLFSADQRLEPIRISEVTYAFMLAIVILTLVVPRLARIPLWVILTAMVPVFLVFEAWIGPLVGGSTILLTIAEIFFLSITTILARSVSQAIHEFEEAVEHITFGRRDKMPESASLGQGAIYREIRRARNHQRPLTMMAIAVDEKSIKMALDRMIQEAQLAMMVQYALSSVSKTLCDKLADCDVVVQNNNHFLVVLPETTAGDVPGLIRRLRQQVFDQVGVDLKIGTSALPQDGFTFEGLLERATQEMMADQPSQQKIEPERLSMERSKI